MVAKQFLASRIRLSSIGFGTKEATVTGYGKKVENPKQYGNLLEAQDPFLEVHFDFNGRRHYSAKDVVRVFRQFKETLPKIKQNGWKAIVGTTTNPVLISRAQQLGAQVVPVPLGERIRVKENALVKLFAAGTR